MSAWAMESSVDRPTLIERDPPPAEVRSRRAPTPFISCTELLGVIVQMEDIVTDGSPSVLEIQSVVQAQPELRERTPLHNLGAFALVVSSLRRAGYLQSDTRGHVRLTAAARRMVAETDLTPLSEDQIETLRRLSSA